MQRIFRSRCFKIRDMRTKKSVWVNFGGSWVVNRGFYKKKLDTHFNTHCIKIGVQLWQGWQDSNLRMSQSKCDALPLGYTPVYMQKSFMPDKYVHIVFDVRRVSMNKSRREK